MLGSEVMSDHNARSADDTETALPAGAKGVHDGELLLPERWVLEKVWVFLWGEVEVEKVERVGEREGERGRERVSGYVNGFEMGMGRDYG